MNKKISGLSKSNFQRFRQFYLEKNLEKIAFRGIHNARLRQSVIEMKQKRASFVYKKMEMKNKNISIIKRQRLITKKWVLDYSAVKDNILVDISVDISNEKLGKIVNSRRHKKLRNLYYNNTNKKRALESVKKNIANSKIDKEILIKWFLSKI